MLVRTILIIKISNNSTRACIVKKGFKGLELLEEVNINFGVSSFYNTSSREEYINLIIEKSIKYDKIDKLFFILQNESVIVREYKNICNLRKGDIAGYINFEICQDMPIDLANYIVKYKILNKAKSSMDLQLILFPKNISNICLDIARRLNIKRRYLNINFDILQKLIDSKNISLDQEKYMIIENLEEQVILNYVEDSIVHTSSVLEKDGNEEYIINFLNKDINIFYYGISDLFLKKLLQERKNVNKLKLNLDKRGLLITKSVDKEPEEYMLEVGVVI